MRVKTAWRIIQVYIIMPAIAKAGMRISELNRSKEIHGESMFLKEPKLNNAILCK